MILRLRTHALLAPRRDDLDAIDAAEAAWAETLHRLATSHRLRRELDAAVRWPLAHACTQGDTRMAPVLGADPLDIESGGSNLNRVRCERHAFCCGALR